MVYQWKTRPMVHTFTSANSLNNDNIIESYNNPSTCNKESLQSFYRRTWDENVHQPLCIDYPDVTSGIRELSAKTYIK